MNKAPVLLGSLITKISPNLVRYASAPAATGTGVSDLSKSLLSFLL